MILRLALITVFSLATGACKERKAKTTTVEGTEVHASVSDAGSPERTQPKLVRAQPLPMEAGIALRSQMLNHGDDMENLLWSTLMLDYEGIEAIAGKMSNAPTYSRAGAGQEDTINAMLPAEFFESQNQLHVSIAKLRSAAQARKDPALAEEYANVVKSCIECHSLYLHFPVDEDD